MAINFSKYPRPGIFQEEINDSVRENPLIENINQLVIGFSKKGPRMAPVLIRNSRQREEVFGTIDRNMEKKGSYFHRTIDNLISSGPVLALNLLLYDDNLDELTWKSVSTSSSIKNKASDKNGISQFFNKNGFWERDTEALLTVANLNVMNPEHVLHFVNHSDKQITVFAYKSSIKNFDVTATEWYSSESKSIPTFMNPNELISDYFITVLVVAGDWTDYNKLQADIQYGRYFNSSGLIKTEINNFITDTKVSVLGSYDCCLIPFFRDKSGNSFFIETLINNDTDRTGLYVSFDTTLIESTDYPNGFVDTIGNSLVDGSITEIDFLSYKENIQERIEYPNEYLNKLGNTYYKMYNQMVADFQPARSVPNDLTEGRIFNMEIELLNPSDVITTTDIATINILKGNPALESYYVLSGIKMDFDSMLNTTIEINRAAINTHRIDVLVVDASGNMSIIEGTTYPTYAPTSTELIPTVPADILILGVIKHGIGGNTYTYDPVSVATTGGVEDGNIVLDFSPTTAATISTSSPTEYNLITEPVDTVIYNFNNTDGNIVGVNQYSNIITYYEGIRTLRSYQYLKNKLLAAENPIFIQTALSVGNPVYTKTPIQARIFTDNTLTSDAKVELKFSGNINVRVNQATLYFVDDELILGGEKIITSLEGSYDQPFVTGVFDYVSPDVGVISSNSKLYKDYFDGYINNGDYIYDARFVSTGIPLPKEHIEIERNVIITPLLTIDRIVLHTPNPGNYTFTLLQKVLLKGTTFNDDKEYTINNIIIGANYIELWTVEDVVDNEVSSDAILYDATKIHLKFSLINNELTIQYFADYDLISPAPFTLNSLTVSTSFDIRSLKNNFKQTVDIDQVLAINRVLVDAARYGELQIGDYLSAYIDTNALEIGEVPRRLTRIIDKKQYTPNPNLVELITDSQININSYILGANTLYQTYGYRSIENYVTTYKGMAFNGFKLRPESMPDGTEERQNQLLNLVTNGTPLYNGLINNDQSSWRYLIDSFGLGLQPQSKQQYLDLLYNRFDAAGFINMPSAAQFKKSNNPSFKDDTGNLVIKHIKDGADLSKNPTFRYSFGVGNGQSYVGYFWPYLQINDNGRPLDFPPASYVAQAYMRKFTSTLATIGTGTIIAGVDTGLISGITNIEIDISPNDINYLVEMGANAIVFRNNQGFAIESEYTAAIKPKSSLSYLHSREILIELEKELAFMLRRYQWKFNSPETRSEIEFRANQICQTYKRKGYLYDFRNIMNESNNPPAIIDAQFGVLNTYVELVKGLETIVNSITILRTGDIRAGRFGV